jgi:hypothetical protein
MQAISKTGAASHRLEFSAIDVDGGCINEVALKPAV